MTSSALDRVRAAARDAFGHHRLLPGQAEATAAVLEGHDVLRAAPPARGLARENSPWTSSGSADAAVEADAPYRVQEEVVHAEFGPSTVRDVEDDRVTVLFERVGYRTLATEVVQREGLLEDA